MAASKSSSLGKNKSTPPVTRSQLTAKSPITGLKDQVAKLIDEQVKIKQLIINTNKENEELTNKLEQEIASLKEIIKVKDEDHKSEIRNLIEANMILEKEIKLVKDKLQKELGPSKSNSNNNKQALKDKSDRESNKPGNVNGQKKQLYSEAVGSKCNKAAKLDDKNKKSKVLVLADSHGRECWDLLDKKLKNEFDVQVVFKPNAPLKEVVSLAKPSVRDLHENDHLIILGGTNDINSNGDNPIPQVLKSIEELVPLSKKTNLIINTIPTRFDKPELNKVIEKTNREIHKTINSLKNKNVKRIKINFINERLNRTNYTNHGLHLNKSGKNILCDRLASFVKCKLPVNSGAKDTFLTKWLIKGKQK